MILYCNKDQCKFNEKQQCMSDKVYFVNQLCVTYRRRARRENYQAMMQTTRSNCHKSNGKYKVDHFNLIK